MQDQVLSYLLFGGFIAITVLVIGFLAIVTLIKAFRGTFFGASSPYQAPIYQPPAAFPQNYRPRASSGGSGNSLGNFAAAIIIITLLGIGIVFGLTGEILHQDNSLKSVDNPNPEIFDAPQQQEGYSPPATQPKPAPPPVSPPGPKKYVRGQESVVPMINEPAPGASKAKKTPDFFANYALQYGAFSQINNALKNRDRLTADGHIVQVADYGDGLYRVLILDDFANAEQALRYKRKYGLQRGSPVPLRKQATS